MGIEFRILGPLEVLKDGHAVQLGTRMQRALLAVLLLRANEVLSNDRLIEDLWPDHAPPTALKTLRAYVSRLRRALDDTGSMRLRTVGSGYRLEVAPDMLDRDRFEHLIADARWTADRFEASGLLASALGLWRGPVLADLAYPPFAQAEITRLEELRLLALEERIEADIELGRHAEVVGEIRSLVGEHPFRERLWAGLMLALYRGGRQAEALEVYREARSSLVEELGLEPGPALKEIEAAILRHDSSLQAGVAGDPVAQMPAAEGTESPQPPRPPPIEVRKTVTVVFCDVAGSTSLGERHDPEALRQAMKRYFDTAADVFQSHGGTVEKFIGDAVMAVFGVPALHEDDALRAVRAAWELSRRLPHLNDELASAWGVRLETRTGINTGEVVAGGDSTDQGLVTGDPVNTAARLQQAADPGMILIGEDTYRLVAGAIRARPADPMPLRGKSDLVRAFSVADVAAGAPSFVRRLEAPLVGRRSELAQLRQAFDRSAREQVGFLFTVIGPPGIGKTRLALQFEGALSGVATVLTGRCLSYGEGITYWPIREVLDAAFEGDPVVGIERMLSGDSDVGAVVETIAAALGSSSGTSTTGEVGWALRKVFEALARDTPLVVVFEDIHWGEPTFLDLVDRVVDLVSGAPVMVLCLARPELLEARPAWGGGKFNAATTLLEPLTEEESALLLRRLATLEGRAEAEILRTAEGNPLFVEQLLAAAAEVGSTGDLRIPPTIEGLLAARIDRLPPEERAVVERAAIIGKEFEAGAVEDLLPRETRGAVAERLESLVRKQFVRRERPAADGGQAFAFRHVLIQLVAYDAIAKRRRADLHERLTGWIDRRKAGDRAEYEEVVGYHLEQAHRYLIELGRADDRSRTLGQRASSLLARCGRAALDRGDMPACVNLLSRALALTPADAPTRPGLLVDLSLALGLSGRFEDEAARLEEAAASARVAGDRSVGSLVAIRKVVFSMRQSSTSIETLLLELSSMLPDLEEAGDHRVLGEAWEHVGILHNWLGRSTEAEQALERAVQHARAARDRRGEVFRLGLLMSVIVDGPTSVEEAIARLPLLFERSGSSKVTESRMLRNLCTLQAMKGDIAEARRSWRRSHELHQELGIFFTAHMILGYAELAAGDPAEAEGPLRDGIGDLEAAGETGYLGTTAGVLAEVLWRVGKAEEAERYVRVSQRLAAPDDWVGQWQWRGALAKVLADRGELPEAERLARVGSSMVDRTDQLRWRGDARMSLAYVLRKAGRTDEATTVLREALELYELKGDVADASKARAGLRNRPTN